MDDQSSGARNHEPQGEHVSAVRPGVGVDAGALHAELARRGIDLGIGSTGLVVLHSGDVSLTDLDCFWRVLEELQGSTGAAIP